MPKARDLTIFFVATGLAAVHFLLKTQGTPLEPVTWIYILMWTMSLVLLLWLKVYGGERDDLVDYDENLKRDHLPFLFGAVAAIVVVSSLFVSGFAQSAIYVPRPGLALNVADRAAAVMDDLLYNFVLVAPAEENIKLVAIITLYRKTENELLSVGLPVGFWALLHGYVAYVGPYMWILILSAFISGLILYGLLKYTRSLENAILAHGCFNSFVILSSYF